MFVPSALAAVEAALIDKYKQGGQSPVQIGTTLPGTEGSIFSKGPGKPAEKASGNALAAQREKARELARMQHKPAP